MDKLNNNNQQKTNKSAGRSNSVETFIIPSPTAEDKKGGWKVNTDLMTKIINEIKEQNDGYCCLQWEDINDVLKALKKVV